MSGHEIRNVIKTKKTKIISNICLVCEDKPYGCNFGVTTCQSCKQFFRRHMGMMNEELKCSSKGNCVINRTTRKTCSKCRFQKCFQVGMRMGKKKGEKIGESSGNSDSIGEPSNTKRKYVKEDEDESEVEMIFENEMSNRKEIEIKNPKVQIESSSKEIKKETSNSANGNCSDLLQFATVGELLTIRVPLHTALNFCADTIQTLVESPMVSMVHQPALDRPPSPPIPDDNEKNGDRAILPKSPFDQNVHLNLDRIDEVLASFGMDWQKPLPSPALLINQLNRLRLEELHISTEEWYKNTKYIRPLRGSTYLDFSPEDNMNLVHRMISSNMKQYSRLSSFQNLPPCVKEILIKNAVLIRIFLICVTTYDQDTFTADSRFYPGRPRLPFNIGRRYQGEEIYNKTYNCATQFPLKLRHDDSLTLILSAIALFNADLLPQSTLESDLETVVAEKYNYFQLLKEHLEGKFDRAEANLMYSYLRPWINNLNLWIKRAVTEAHRLYFDINPDTFDLLMIDFRHPD